MTLRIESNRVFIGGREFKLSLYSPPMKDGTIYLIEATSNPANTHKTKLTPAELHGVLGAMLPSGMEILIYEAQGMTPGLHLVSFQNLSRGRCIKLCLSVAFQDWAYRTNLIHFAEDVRSSAERDLPGCQVASIEKSEYGVSIWIQVMLGEKDDCFELFNASDEKLYSLYKDALLKSDSKFAAKLESQSSANETGFRWWVRYVVVPLISGGMGAALVSWVLSRL